MARQALPGDARLVLVTKDSAYESPSKLRELAPAGVELVMSSAAWEAYEVPASPYFVYVDGATARVYGEGTAAGWPQLDSLLRDSISDIAVAEAAGLPADAPPIARGAAERAERIDADLARAGIGPGHASLYPASGEAPPDGEST